MIKYRAFCVLFLLVSLPTWAQYSLCGKVVSQDKVQDNATITILETNENIKTNAKGDFCFSGLSAGEYSLQATDRHGFMSPIERLIVNEDISGIEVDLTPDILGTVTLSGETNRARVRENHSIKTNVINLDEEVRSSTSVEELMNRTAGIRVRNTGGLGNDADVVVGGFNGKSVKFLIDGVPIDYLGSSMGLTKLPTDAADYIEVYKGVMPTEVGIDALGGAINIVTKKPNKTSHRVSYEGGSFNTHKINFNSHIQSSDKLSFGINAFVNYSDNDFKVDNLPLEEPETGKTKYIRTRLFHNGYKQYSAEAHVSLKNRTWADLFKIKLDSYALKNEIQNDFSSRNRPFGGVYNKESAYVVPSLEYKKSFFDDRLELSQFVVYSSIKNDLADPEKNIAYDWLGNKHETSTGSEMGSDLSNIEGSTIETRLNNLTYRGLFSYKLNNDHKFILNVVNNYFHRKADDLENYHQKTRVNYNRLIVGLGYQFKFFENRLEGLTQAKFLDSKASGSLNNEITKELDKPIDNNGFSFAQSLKYNFYNGWVLRGSVENTYRLPDHYEIFGDNNLIAPNLTLKPEKSFNVNFGLRYRRKKLYSLEANAYYRNTKDLIRLKDITQFTSVFLNLDNVRGFGLELEGKYRPIKHLEFSGNLTLNDFRFEGSNGNLNNDEHFKDARISNMPFYFGNAAVSYDFDKVFKKNDNLRLYWNYTYVHQYYLDFIEKQFEPDGFLNLFGKSKIHTDRIIPVQQVHSAGFVWTLARKSSKNLSLSAEIKNIFNESIYNRFKMQSPGRSFSAKITYEF